MELQASHVMLLLLNLEKSVSVKVSCTVCSPLSVLVHLMLHVTWFVHVSWFMGGACEEVGEGDSPWLKESAVKVKGQLCLMVWIFVITTSRDIGQINGLEK